MCYLEWFRLSPCPSLLFRTVLRQERPTRDAREQRRTIGKAEGFSEADCVDVHPKGASAGDEEERNKIHWKIKPSTVNQAKMVEVDE